MILFKSEGPAFKGSWAALIPKSTEMEIWWACMETQCDILVALRKNMLFVDGLPKKIRKYTFCICSSYNTSPHLYADDTL